MTRAALCPACLSALEPASTRCAHCGAALGGDRPRTRRRVAAAALALAAVAAAGVWASRLRSPDEGPAVPAETPAAEPARAVPLHHLVLVSAEEPERRTPALALADGAGGAPSLLLALAALPLRGGFRDADGNAVPVVVRAFQLDAGFVLLGAAPPDGTVEPLPAGASARLPVGTELEVRAPDGGRAVARLLGRAPDRLRVDAALPAGAALVDGGRAVGFALGGGEVLALDGLLPALRSPATRPLAAVQQEIAAWAPGPLRTRIAELLHDPTSAADVRDALARLDRVALRARTPAELDELDGTRRAATLLLVRLLARDDPPAAALAARQAVARYPSDAAVLADAVVVLLGDGDVAEAARLFEQLRPLSDEQAGRLAEGVVTALAQAADRLGAQQRLAEAIALLDEATRIFPAHADLHAARAGALRAAGRADEALAAAERAAALDRSHAPRLAAYRDAVREADERRHGPGAAVEIPLDPATHSIRAEVRVGGLPVDLIVDTGASYTTVPTAIAERLGLLGPGLQTVRVATAGGEIDARMVVLPDLRIGSIHLRRIRALVIDLPGSLGGKGLLGLETLRRLNLRLDSENARLLLQERRRRRR